MKIFVFGAGASRGAQNQATYTPDHLEVAPLVNDLFNEQYSDLKIEGLNFDIEKCRKMVKGKGTLEGWLTEKWVDIDSLKTDRAKRSERSWFGHVNLHIWNVLNRVSRTYPNAQGYSLLLQKLYDEDFGLVSFNYDTLLDQSYQDVFHAQLLNKEAYLQGNFVKLHGSVNWFLGKRADEDLPPHKHKGDIGVRIRAIAENMYNSTPFSLDSLEILDPKHDSLSDINKAMEYFSNSGYFYPLLFMPLTAKDYGVVADFGDVLVSKAKEMFRSATEVYLIGYSASDDLINDLLSLCPADTPLHVVGKGSVETIMNQVVSRNKNLVVGNKFTKGFVDFVNTYSI